MKTLSCLLGFTVAIYALVVTQSPASATGADITGTWEITIHYQPDDSDYRARYVLKQEGEKITGTYHGMYGPADVTGTVKSNDVVLTVTLAINGGSNTAHFSGKVSSPDRMSGTVTGTSDKPRKWSAQKK